MPYGIISPGEVLPLDFFRGGGGGCHMVLFPPGEVLIWDFFRGGGEGEGLPYGIISRGTICHGNCSLIMKFVCVGGGGRFTIEGEALPYGIVPGEVLPWDFFRGKVCHMA